MRARVNCRNCRHFDNRPEKLERAFPGMASFGSGNASVRDEDGICRLHDRHLPAGSSCAHHAAVIPSARCP